MKFAPAVAASFPAPSTGTETVGADHFARGQALNGPLPSRGAVMQTAIDLLGVAFGLFFLCVFACAVGVALGILYCVSYLNLSS